MYVAPGRLRLVVRRRFGWESSVCLHPSQFGIRAGGQCGEIDAPRESRTVALAVRAYMRAVRRILGWDWPYGAVYCPLAVYVRRHGQLGLAVPCRLLDCPDCLTGHMGRLGLPVLYVRSLPADPAATCIHTAPDEPTLRQAAPRLGLSFQRVHQLEQRALAALPARRLA